MRWRRQKHVCPVDSRASVFVVRHPIRMPDGPTTVRSMHAPMPGEMLEIGAIIRFNGTHGQHQALKDYFTSHAYDLSDEEDVKLLLQEERKRWSTEMVNVIREAGKPR